MDPNRLTDHPIDEQKARLRETARLQRAALSDADRADAAQSAAAHFLAEIQLPADEIVSAYWPVRDEMDCRPLLLRLMNLHYRLCLPVVNTIEIALTFRQWEEQSSLEPSGFGTFAPTDGAPEWTPDHIIIPLLGFDAKGTRLGYGQGHYDRTIAAMPKKPVLIGYAFAAQELPKIPREDHDAPLNYIVTEDGVRKFAA